MVKSVVVGRKLPPYAVGMTKNRSTDEEAALKLLRARGYEVKRRVSYKKVTFEVDELVDKEFRSVVGVVGVKVKEAVSSALRDWIDKHNIDNKKDRGSEE